MIDVPAPIYDRKTATRRFDTIHGILRSLNQAESFLKGRNATILRQWDQTHTFGDKTGSGHFQGIIHNLFIRKSMIPRRMRGLLTTFALLPVLTVFLRIKPEVDFGGQN